MNRVCPNCQEDLGITGNYFCYKCGYKLPPELTTSDVRLSISKLKRPGFEIKEEFDKNAVKVKKKYIFVFVLLLFTAAGFYFVPKYIRSKQIAPIPKQTLVNSDQILKNPVNLTSTTFGARSLASLVPSDADLYVEGSKINQLLYEFTTLNKDSQLLNTNFKVSDFENLVEDQYAIFSKVVPKGEDKTRVWGFVSKSKNDEVIKTIQDVTKESTWSARLIEGYMVVTNSQDLFKEVSDSRNKVTLNLSLNSKYATAKNSLPDQGKLFILVLTDTVQSYIDGMQKLPPFSEKFSTFVTELLKNDKNSYVIQ